MNRGVAIARIQEKLGFTTAHSSYIAGHLQDVQNELEREAFLPKFLIENSHLLQTSVGGRDIALPTGFLRENEDDGPLFYVGEDGEYTKLEKHRTSFLRETFDSTQIAEGAPVAYTLLATSIGIWPLPDAIYDLRFSFYKADTVLSSDGVENKWLTHAHDIMIGMAGGRMAESKRDKDAIAFFNKMEALGRRRLGYNEIAKEQEGTRIMMGGED